MKISIPTKQLVLQALSQLYPGVDFLHVFGSISDSRVFVYGGLLRDMALGRHLKEADLVIMSETPIEKQERILETVLSEHDWTMVGKINERHPGSANYIYSPTSKVDLQHTIDVNLHEGKTRFAGDFTINSLYLDLFTGELFDQQGGLNDLERKILRSVKKPKQSFREDPLRIFRAIKCICQFGLALDPQTKHGIQDNNKYSYETLDFVVNNPQTLLGEWMLDNVFRGLYHDPKQYAMLVQELGIIKVFSLFFSDKLGVTSLLHPNVDTVTQLLQTEKRDDSYEYNLSVFFSSFIQGLPAGEGEKLFDRIITILNFALPKKYYYVGVDIAKMRYHNFME